MEEPEVQLVKNLVKIVVFSQGALNAFASPDLPDELRFLRHGVAAGIFSVARGVGSINGLAMQLGDEDMQDGIQHGLGRAFKKVREADKDASLAETDGAVDVGEAIEADLKFRRQACAGADRGMPAQKSG